PQDRTPAVDAAVRQVGGALQHAWVTLADHDTVVVAELPDEVAANALWNVFKAGAGVERISMEPMITLDDHVRALKLAAKVDYRPPQGQTWDPASFGGPQRPGSAEVVYRGRDGVVPRLLKVELLH